MGLWRLPDWGLESTAIVRLIETCLDLGITTFDHADIYGMYAVEELFGSALALAPGLRKRMQIVTKCGIRLACDARPEHTFTYYDTCAAHVVRSVDNSLRLLHTDHLDVLLIHRPDPLMNADELAQVFEELRQAGKVLHFGVSNFTPLQFELLASRTRLVTHQVEVSLLKLDAFLDGTLDQCQARRIVPMAWSPLSGGRLFDASDERAVRVVRELVSIGAELEGATPDQIAFAWLLAHPARIVPVVGSGKLYRIRAAADATALALSREQWFRLWTASTGEGVP
jgi:predicted oxidoreductase